MITTNLYLIRHGETHWNVLKKLQGHGGSGLNQTGRDQVQQTADTLRDWVFTALYTSDSQRTIETARIISDVVGLEPLADPRLREQKQGDWRGKTLIEAQAQYPDICTAMIQDPTHIAPPRGESIIDVAARMFAALNDIAAAHPGGDVLIVSHRLAIAIAQMIWLDQPLEDSLKSNIRNAGIVPLSWSVAVESPMPLRHLAGIN